MDVSQTLLREIRRNWNLPHAVPFSYRICWPNPNDRLIVRVYCQWEVDEPWECYDVSLAIAPLLQKSGGVER
jgi:hypothetical protein